MGNLYNELKRRKVFRVGGVYVVVAWVLIQAADIVLPTFGAPEWVNRTFIFLFFLGFPVALILSWAYELGPTGIRPDDYQRVQESHSVAVDSKFIYATFALVLLVAGFQVVDQIVGDKSSGPSAQISSAGSGPTIRSSILLGQSQPLPFTAILHDFAFDPAGELLAYTTLEDDVSRIEIRNLADGSTRSLVADGGSVDVPFSAAFSPSGEQVIYARIGTGALHVMPTSGGRARVLTKVVNLAMGPNWLNDRAVVFTHSSDGLLYAVTINDGEIQPLNIPFIEGEGQSWPKISADGEWLLYTVTDSGSFYEGRIDAFNLATKEVRTLIERAYNASFAGSDRIAYMRDEDLWVSICSPNLPEECLIEGRVESGIVHHRNLGVASYAVSRTGMLVFQAQEVRNAALPQGFDQQELVWESRDKQKIENKLPQVAYQSRFSPDGSQLVFNLTDDGDTNIGVYDLRTESISRRSFTGNSSSAIWTADGRQLVYTVRDSNNIGNELWITNADGSGQPRGLVKSLDWLQANDVSPDGSTLIFTKGLPEARRLMGLSLDSRESIPIQLFSDDFVLQNGSISPDGRWIAYVSAELGSFEIFVRPFPNLEDGKWQVSYNTGTDPQWTEDSQQLLFLSQRDSYVYSAVLNKDSLFSISSTDRVFGPIEWSIVYRRNFTATPDGEQLIHHHTIPSESRTIKPSHAVLISNWVNQLQ